MFRYDHLFFLMGFGKLEKKTIFAPLPNKNGNFL